MFDVNYVIADLQIAEVRQKCGDFGFITLRAGSYALRLVKQIARTKDGETGFGEQNAVWHISFGQRRGQNFSGEVGGLVGIAFAAAGSASEAKRNAVFGEHVGQTLDLADVRNGEEHLVV